MQKVDLILKRLEGVALPGTAKQKRRRIAAARLLLQGFSRERVAADLCISLNTLKRDISAWGLDILKREIDGAALRDVVVEAIEEQKSKSQTVGVKS